jgi:hypothetical protein
MTKHSVGVKAPVVAFAVLALALGVGAVTMKRMEPAGTDDASATPVAHAEPVQTWLIKGARPATKVGAGASAPEARDAPRTEATGPLVDRVTALAERLAPAGSKRISAVQYPELRGATATFTAGQSQISLTMQRLSAPIYVADITMGSPEDGYQELPNGLQVVTVRHALPHTFQVIVVREKGVRLTVTVTDGPKVEVSDLYASWSGADRLVQRIQEVAGDVTIDGFAAN